MGRVQVNKAHKTRFSSKSTRNVHKTSLKSKHGIEKPDRNVGKGARTARIQRNKMARDQKRAELLKAKRASSGSASPPRVIVLFGLCASVNVDSLARDLIRQLSDDSAGDQSSTVSSTEYRLRATRSCGLVLLSDSWEAKIETGSFADEHLLCFSKVLKAPHGDLLTCMGMAKVADLIAFVASGNSYCENEDSASYYIDPFGDQCLSVFRGLGLPSTVVLIRDVPSEMKRRHDLKKILRSSLTSEFPEDCRFFSADTKDELHKFIWLFREQKLTVPLWRTQRPYLMAQQVDMLMEDHDPKKSTLLLTGYIRARGLSVNQLVHISGVGDFQLRKIDVLKDPFPLNARNNCDAMDSEEDYHVQVMGCLGPDPEKQEALLEENVPDPLAGEQTWPTEEELAEAVRNLKEKKVKKRTLPRGTSEYQAAWILEDSDSEVLENDEVDDDDDGAMVLDEEPSNITAQDFRDSCFDDDEASLNLRDSDDDTETDSMMVDGEQLTREQIKDEIQKIKEAHAADEEFPDEVETPFDVPARKRFTKYRGVKSFRTSSWDPKESLPPEYARIFSFENFKRTQKHVFAKALEMEKPDPDDCAAAGTYARLYVKDVSTSVATKLCLNAKTISIVACGLLQHESKMSVLHFGLKKYDSYTSPIKAKEELTFHVGFRQFAARPVFSTDNISSDKHKMERFLHAGRFSMASIYAPISFAPLPLVVLKNADDANSAAVAAIGSLRNVDPDRIILKRIILTGYPQRVSKLKASVRYMFHNPEDVRWFKPVEVWTKCGRRGRIMEPVGTHGVMKCVFNGVLQQHDTVCMSLYKRVYPKWPEKRSHFQICDHISQ